MWHWGEGGHPYAKKNKHGIWKSTMNNGSYFLLSNGDFPATPAHAPTFYLQGHSKGAYISLLITIGSGPTLHVPLEVLVKGHDQ